jgi:hypothetical protein
MGHLKSSYRYVIKMHMSILIIEPYSASSVRGVRISVFSNEKTVHVYADCVFSVLRDLEAVPFPDRE